jgi:pimeloyl-ACP methyl ester carboxylesterase
MRVGANGIAIEVDDHGPPSAPPLLLVMGLGMQLTAWPDEFVQLLVSRGFRVIRFDNRDAGLSQSFDELGVPHLAWSGLKYAMRLPLSAPYGVADMANDTLGLLDALGIAQAHVCGASMGGMIAQHLAARHPQRVKSLTLMMTTSGARHLPQASPHLQHALLTRFTRPKGRPTVVQQLEELLTLIGSPAYRADAHEMRQRLEASVRRAWRPGGTARQLVAVAADGDRSSLLSRIHVPTHIIHGQADPLVPVAAAHDLARKIRGATLDLIDGMGHDLPQPLLPRFTQGIVENASRARMP